MPRVAPGVRTAVQLASGVLEFPDHRTIYDTGAPPKSTGAAHLNVTVLHVGVHVRFCGTLGGAATRVVIGPPSALVLTPTVLETVADTEYVVVAFSRENSASNGAVACTTATATVALPLARRSRTLYCTSKPPPMSNGASHTANTELADAFFSVNASGGDGACSGAVATVMLIDDPLVPIPFVAVTVAL
jgi:hypothetical protein